MGPRELLRGLVLSLPVGRSRYCPTNSLALAFGLLVSTGWGVPVEGTPTLKSVKGVRHSVVNKRGSILS